jgi:hypothetical protein
MLTMRRFLLLFLICLLPLQISWAAVTGYCGHEQGMDSHHFGHHDDEHEAFPAKHGQDKQPGQLHLGYDHCHLSGFLGILNETVFDTPAPSAQFSLQYDETAYSNLVLQRPERPKWSCLA